MGVSLVTDRSVTVDPKVNFSSGNIGGPSAGLMFSLEIYDQLTENDLTSGYAIAGTGEVDYNGNVIRIGGIRSEERRVGKECSNGWVVDVEERERSECSGMV